MDLSGAHNFWERESMVCAPRFCVRRRWLAILVSSLTSWYVRRWARERISVDGWRGGRRRRRPVLAPFFFFFLLLLLSFFVWLLFCFGASASSVGSSVAFCIGDATAAVFDEFSLPLLPPDLGLVLVLRPAMCSAEDDIIGVVDCNVNGKHGGVINFDGASCAQEEVVNATD